MMIRARFVNTFGVEAFALEGGGRADRDRAPAAVVRERRGPAPALKLSAWYRDVPFADVLEAAQRHLGGGGLPGGAAWCGAFFNPRDVRLRVGPLALRVAHRSEDHVVVDATAAGPAAASVERLLIAFHALVRDPAVAPRECILAEGAALPFPFFTHSFFRGLAGLPRRVRDGRGARRVGPGEPGYWGEGVRRLHFVRRALLGAPGSAPVDAWSARLGAAWRLTAGGILFDCGWSAAWPVEATGVARGRATGG